ncbi:MAG: PaaI family thioesterase [Acidimicrobiia bacterium]
MVDESAYGDFALKQFLGMEIEGNEPGRASARVTIGDRHLNPNGVVHGAVLFAMVDTAMGKAVMSVLPDGQFCASVDVQLRFIRPASDGELVADVVVLKQGRSVVHLDARVHDADDRLIATAAGTFAVIVP